MNLKHINKALFFLSVLVYIVASSCNSGQKQEKETASDTNRIEITHPDWIRNATLYEVNVRQYSQEGTFKAVEEDLPRLKDMGIRILWLMPVHPIGVENRKGGLGSYYSVKDYKAVNPEFGSMEDFKDLVDAVHENEMYLIIDWVANHSAWDNQLAYDHPEWYVRDSVGNFTFPFDWSDVIQFDHTNPELKQYLIDAMKFWVEETDIDGFRCDAAHLLPTEFWNDAYAQLREIKHLYMLAEAEVPEHHFKAFDVSYGWKMHHLMNEIAAGDKNANDIERNYQMVDTVYPPHSILLQFTSNHDENSWNGTVFERLGDGVEAFAVFTFTYPGMPLVYNGQEAAMRKRLLFFEKDPIEWQDYALQSFYSKLIHLKLKNEALWSGAEGGSFERIETENPEKIFAFSRIKETQAVLVVLNLSGEELNTNINTANITGDYTDLFSGDLVSIEGNWSIDLSPWDYQVLVKKMPVDSQ